MAQAEDYRSFLLRVWCQVDASDPESSPTWQGELEQIQSGQCWRFRSIDELVRFLAAFLLDLSEESVDQM